MVMTPTEHLYVVRADDILDGEPVIKGTHTPVRSIVNWWKMKVSAEEIVEYMPHLTLAQVFDALSYYHDHPEEIDSYIEQNRVPDELIDPIL